MKSEDLDVKQVRKMMKNLVENQRFPVTDFKVREARLTEDGAVEIGGGFAYMHPESFREVYGESEYQLLLARPRVPSPYPDSGEEDGASV